VRPGHQKQIPRVLRAHKEAIARCKPPQFEFVANPFPSSMQESHDIRGIRPVHDQAASFPARQGRNTVSVVVAFILLLPIGVSARVAGYAG
jgi:hypothetical protein